MLHRKDLLGNATRRPQKAQTPLSVPGRPVVSHSAVLRRLCVLVGLFAVAEPTVSTLRAQTAGLGAHRHYVTKCHGTQTFGADCTQPLYAQDSIRKVHAFAEEPRRSAKSTRQGNRRLEHARTVRLAQVRSVGIEQESAGHERELGGADRLARAAHAQAWRLQRYRFEPLVSFASVVNAAARRLHQSLGSDALVSPACAVDAVA